MDEFDLTFIGSLITAMLQGGHSSVVAILLLDLLIILVVVRFAFRYIIATTSSQVKELKDIIIAKDRIIYEQSGKFEAVIEKYHTNQVATTEALRRMEHVIREIQLRLTLIVEDKVELNETQR